MAAATVKSLLTLAAFAVSLVAATTAFGAPDAAPRKATLTIVDPSPLTVAGHGFRRGERVTVKVVGDGAVRRKVVVASLTGRLTARWTEAVLSECSPYVVTATGARGSRAMLRRIQIAPACGIVIQP
jgi:hypothetical protein